MGTLEKCSGINSRQSRPDFACVDHAPNLHKRPCAHDGEGAPGICGVPALGGLPSGLGALASQAVGAQQNQTTRIALAARIPGTTTTPAKAISENVQLPWNLYRYGRKNTAGVRMLKSKYIRRIENWALHFSRKENSGVILLNGILGGLRGSLLDTGRLLCVALRGSRSSLPDSGTLAAREVLTRGRIFRRSCTSSRNLTAACLSRTVWKTFRR